MSEIEKASNHFFQGYCDKDKHCNDVNGSFQQPFVIEYEIDEFIYVLRLPDIDQGSRNLSYSSFYDYNHDFIKNF